MNNDTSVITCLFCKNGSVPVVTLTNGLKVHESCLKNELAKLDILKVELNNLHHTKESIEKQ